MKAIHRWRHLAAASVVAAGLGAVAVDAATASTTGRAAASKGTAFMLPKFIGAPVFTQAANGAKKVGKAVGWTVKYGGPTTGSATQQVNFINNAAAAGDKGIMISADDPNAVSPALRRAMQRGTKVVSFDSDVLPNARTIYVQGASADSIAQTELNMLGSQIGYKGSFAILSAQATDTNQVQWNNVLKQDLKKSKYKNMKLVAIVNPPDDGTPSAVKYAQNILQKYPTIKGIIAPTSVALPAAAQVVQQQHACGKYVVTGLGDPLQMKSYVKNGCAKQFAIWSFYKEGEVAMCALNHVDAGTLTGKTGQSFTCPKGVGKYTVAKNATVTAGPAEVFSKKNLSAFTF